MLHWTQHVDGVPQNNDWVAVATSEQKLYSFSWYNDKKKRRMDVQVFKQKMEVHVFNTVSLGWEKLTLEGPSMVMCYGYTAVLIGDTVYVWGTAWRKGCCYNVLHAFDVDAHRWFQPRVSGNVPEYTRDHSACALKTVMFIIGGYRDGTGWSNDLHKLDTSTMVWTLINTGGTPPPSQSSGHSVTIIGTKMFVFGGGLYAYCGGGSSYYNNSISVFDTESNLWLDKHKLCPKIRFGHSAFNYNGELYIFGGRNDEQTFNDVWKFSPETFSWKKVKPKGKGPRPMFRMCCCMMGDRIILFGGRKGNNTIGIQHTNELYILDFSPSLKTLCKLVVIQYSLSQSELPHNIRWELAARTANR